MIDRQVRHLSRLIDDLLDVSRINQGKIQLRKEVVDVVPILNSALDTVRPFAETRGHQLSTIYGPGPLRVEADPVRLEQVVVNLLTNAAKYTESGGRIWLHAGSEGADLVIRVRDTGIGMNPDRLPEMFDLFVQGERSIARSEGGLGIGLTLVKSLVEMHGGQVSATSEGPGKGSEFVVRLPAAIGTRGSEAGLSASDRKARAENAHRILVVDDNVDSARGLARLLKLLGHEVRTAGDGEEALAVAADYVPGVVLLDIGLPGMDGYQVARELRKQADSKDALIVAISGYGQDEDRRRAKEAGFDFHFVKPLDHAALLSVLETR